MAWGQGLGAQGVAHTSAVAVVICVPPEAPTTMRTWPSRPTMIAGHMEESGCFPVAGRCAKGDREMVSCLSGTPASSLLEPATPHLA